MLAQGALGVVDKGEVTTELRQAIQAAPLGRPYLSTRLRPLVAPSTTLAWHELSPREMDVAWLLSEGLTLPQIAKHAQRNIATIRRCRHRVLRKLGLFHPRQLQDYLRVVGLPHRSVVIGRIDHRVSAPHGATRDDTATPRCPLLKHVGTLCKISADVACLRPLMKRSC